jgi:hypothetical protein
VDVAFLDHRIELEDFSIERGDDSGEVGDIRNLGAGQFLQRIGTAGQHVAEILLEIERADQLVDLAGNLTAVLGQDLQFGFHRVGRGADIGNGCRQVFGKATG